MYIWKVPEDWGDQGQCVTVERAFMSLQGHRSIVNQVRFNPSNHMLISAGVEKVLKVSHPILSNHFFDRVTFSFLILLEGIE